MQNFLIKQNFFHFFPRYLHLQIYKYSTSALTQLHMLDTTFSQTLHTVDRVSIPSRVPVSLTPPSV